jgi:MFS transporter, DHA1 family, tetracycline resistance protein
VPLPPTPSFKVHYTREVTPVPPDAVRQRPNARSPLLAIFLIVAVDVLGFTIILPLLPFYSEHLGATPAVVGALVSMYAICQLVAGPILGQLSDRHGRRPILLISQAGTLAGFLLLAVAGQLWIIFLARAIDGATAGNLSVAQAYISDVTEPENRAKSFALIGIAFGLGFTVGPAISGALFHWGYQAPIYAAAALSALSILGTFFLLPRREAIHEHNEADPDTRRLSLFSWGEYRRYFRDPQLARLLGQWAMFAFSFTTFMTGFALFAERRYQWNQHPVGPREVGYIFTFVGVFSMIMQGGLVGRAVKWFGERKVIRIGFISSFLFYIALGLTHTIGQLLFVLGVSSIGGAGLRPALTSLITQKAGRREQGVIIGLTQSIMSVCQIIAPLIAGFMIQQHWLTLWAVWAGVLAGLALLFEARSKQTPSQEREPEPQTSRV